MIIKSIKLTNFRIHKNYKLDCNKETSLIVGENGCGKTSVLEAIYEAMRGKSFKAVDSEIIKRGEDFYRVELNYINGEKVVVVYDGKKKTFLVGDKKTARLPKKDRYPVVLFEPSDLNLISFSPNRRREYFDRMFGQIDDKYSVSLSKYNKALKQRNELLKIEFLKSEDVFSWNVMLSKYGCELFKMRSLMTVQINKDLTKVYRTIADNKDDVFIEYLGVSKDISESKYLKELESSFERDRFLGHTTFGIQKDDYKFIFNKVAADGSASRGEVRSIVLALKFIEAAIDYEKLGKKPVILLDDVFSELDEKRQKCLVKNFKDNQIILTSVDEI